MDGGMQERGQEMSLERGSRNGRQGDRQRGQLIPRPGGRVDKGTGSCWTGSSSEVAREVGGVGSKAGALLQGLATWGPELDQGSLSCPSPTPGVWLPAPCSGPGPRVYIELGSCWGWR